MLNTLRYSFKTGEPLDKSNLNRRILDIDQRIHALEIIKISWEETVLTLENMGLKKINEVLTPLINESQALLTKLQTARNELISPSKIQYVYGEGEHETRLIKQIAYFGDVEITTEYQYSENDEITEMIVNDGAFIRYTDFEYDEHGRIISQNYREEIL